MKYKYLIKFIIINHFLILFLILLLNDFCFPRYFLSNAFNHLSECPNLSPELAKFVEPIQIKHGGLESVPNLISNLVSDGTLQRYGLKNSGILKHFVNYFRIF